MAKVAEGSSAPVTGQEHIVSCRQHPAKGKKGTGESLQAPGPSPPWPGLTWPLSGSCLASPWQLLPPISLVSHGKQGVGWGCHGVGPLQQTPPLSQRVVSLAPCPPPEVIRRQEFSLPFSVNNHGDYSARLRARRTSLPPHSAQPCRLTQAHRLEEVRQKGLRKSLLGPGPW